MFVPENEIDGRLSQQDFPAKLSPIAGGSAFNVIRTVSHLGLGITTGFVGVAGLRDARLVPDTQTDGIDTAFFVQSTNHVPGRCIVLGAGQDSKLLTAPGATVAFANLIKKREQEIAESGGTTCRLVDYLAQARWIHVTSFAIPKSPTRSPLPFLVETIQAAKLARPGLIISFDPGDEYTQTPSREVIKLLELADYVFLNMREFRNLSQHDNASKAPIAELARGLYARGPFSVQVIVLKGPASDFWIHKVQERVYARCHWHRWLPSFLVPDDVGAGDVFAGGVIAGNLRPAFDEYGRGPTMLATALVRAKLSKKGEIPFHEFEAISRRLADQALARERFNLLDFARLWVPPLARYVLAFLAGIAGGIIGTVIVQQLTR